MGVVRLGELEEAVDPSRVITERELLERWQGKACDRVVAYPGRLVLIEAGSRRMTLPTRATGGWADLERDLALGVIEKAEQLAGTVDRLRKGPPVERLGPLADAALLPVVVLPGPFPHLPSIIERINEAVSANPHCAPLRGPSIRPLVVLTAKDYEALIALAEGGYSIAHLLETWQASPLAQVAFWNWLTTEGPPLAGPPSSIGAGAERFLDRGMALFGDTA